MGDIIFLKNLTPIHGRDTFIRIYFSKVYIISILDSHAKILFYFMTFLNIGDNMKEVMIYAIF